MEKIKREKHLSKAICITLAVILWLYVCFYENPTMSKTASDVPVKISEEQLERLRNNNFSVYSISEKTIDVKVTAQRLSLSKLNDETLTAYINLDFSKIKEGGKYSFPIRIVCDEAIAASYFPESENIEVIIEPVKTSTFEFEVDIDEDYVAFGSYEVEEENVVISAPESIFNQIAAVKTEPVAVDKGVDKATKLILLYDKDGNLIENDLVNISPKKVNISITYLEPKTVPVVLRTTDSKEYILPAENNIQVYADSAALANVQRVYTTEVSISNYTVNSKIDVKLELPDNIKVSKENEEISVKLLPDYFN